jgi:predicted house-cleaning noncanonical NTP pyrophosphatase (MazG superfamily)
MIRHLYSKKGKLVRDRIPGISEAKGHVVKVRQLSREELPLALIGKVPEELAELRAELKSGDAESEKKEIADLQTLIDAYIEARGYDRTEIEQIKQQKLAERGGFKEGLWIDWMELDLDTAHGQRLLEKFRKEPRKYIEEER